MRVLQVFNQQRALQGGEEKMVNRLIGSLRAEGVEVELYMPSSRSIGEGSISKLSAATSGFYSFSSYREITEIIERFRPNVVNVHNIYPLVSPAVFGACRDANVPSVFHVASQILSCPTWYHVYDGAICEKCLGGREYWCIAQNCRSNILESAVYAARHAFARKAKLFDSVTLFVAMSEFMAHRMSQIGIEQARIAYVPNMVSTPAGVSPPPEKTYVAYAGRLSPEKGVEVLLSAANALPHIQFRIAGDGPQRSELEAAAPTNVLFEGLLTGDHLSDFFAGARVVVMPSLTYESSGLTAMEALSYGVPVVASRIGALPELVIDRHTGLLVDPGSSDQLGRAIDELWSDRQLAYSLGCSGRSLVEQNHNAGLFVSRTLSMYQRAISLHAGSPNP